jgi:hypothetical protein
MINQELGYTDVKEGESPMYTSDSSSPPNSLPVGYYPDANTVEGLAAMSLPSYFTSTAATAGPNNIVTTTGSGTLPPAVIPGSGTTVSGQVLSYMEGTLAYLKANLPVGAAVGKATDVGPHGSLYLYLGSPLVGDGGWLLLAGS